MAKKSIRSILHTRKQEPTQLDRIEGLLIAINDKQQPSVLHVTTTEHKFNIILQRLAEGRKIEAIKEYRAAFGVGLREAKEAVCGELNL